MSVGDIMGQILPTRMQLRDATNAPVQILTMPQAVKYVWSQSSRRKRPARQDAPPSWAQKSEPKLRASWKGDKIKAYQTIITIRQFYRTLYNDDSNNDQSSSKHLFLFLFVSYIYIYYNIVV